MKTKKSILALVVLLVLVFMQGQAGADSYTGNMLVKQMLEYEKADGNMISNLYSVGYYAGYISGVSSAQNRILFEFPEGVNMGQICAVVSKYLKNHPEIWNKSAIDLVVDALMEAFPLKK
jgi:hypothetical protein